MPVYCFKCPRCGFKDEVLYKSVNEAEKEGAPLCGHDGIWVPMVRDYLAENPVFIPDWKPGFNTSIGLPFSGRRDLVTKMRASKHYPVGLGGGVTKPDRIYYGDEEYRDKVLREYDHTEADRRRDEEIRKALDNPEMNLGDGD